MSEEVKVAFQGEAGAFSEQAARQLLGTALRLIPCARFEDVFRALAGNEADAAVVPIENTLHGSVHENYDHLLRWELPIAAETSVRIVHNLIVMPEVRWKQIRRVFSHPVALAQCLDFFASHPQLERVPYYDTAGSVKMLAQDHPPDGAAIASAVAADTYGGKILRRSVEDDRRNFTRFFLLRRPDDVDMPPREHAKTSLVFSTRNSPGALFRSLSAFALRDLDLTKIESRPLRGKPWEYAFYLDFLGHTDDPNVRNALGHLREAADMLRILGCYPQERPGRRAS